MSEDEGGGEGRKGGRRTIPPLRIAAHANWTAMGI